MREDGPQCFSVRVHERGVGWTRACGTGAVAVAAAAVFHERNGARAHESYAAYESGTRDRAGERPQASGVGAVPSVRVSLEGGALEVTLGATESFDVYTARMRGPARAVFRGEVDTQ